MSDAVLFDARDDGIAVTPLAGVIDFNRNSRQALDHELACLGGVPAGTAGGDVR